ncbi:MAG: hypothetical protein Q7S40_34230 [Opitutaceae bacterium]|nr:hypothetical protein [Opitutaceae bacterium]
MTLLARRYPEELRKAYVGRWAAEEKLTSPSAVNSTEATPGQ